MPTVHRQAWSGDLRDPTGGGRVRGRGAALGERDIGPGWADLREPVEPAFGSADDGGEAGAGRSAWLAEEHARAVRAASAPGAVGSGPPVPFNARAWVAEMCPAGAALKYVDVRSALPVMPPPSQAGAGAGRRRGAAGGGGAAPPSWIDLSESLLELVPRFDRRGAPVLTLAARLTARGASQVDCDSVDPSLEAPPAAPPPSARGGGGGGGARPTHLPPPVGLPRAIVELWPGMPQTLEWEQASLRLNRALHRGVLARKGAATGASSSSSSSAPAAAQSPSPRATLLSPGPVYGSPLAPSPQPRTLTLAANSTWLAPTLEHCVGRAAALLEARAYLHWYERFGVTAEHLTVALESVQATADAYRALQRAPG